MITRLPPAVLFDWDNTLIDTFPAIFAAHNAVRTAIGALPWTEAEARANIRLAAKDAFPIWYGDRAAEAERVYTDYIRSSHLEHMAHIDGTRELLDHLYTRQVPMGVVSNKRGEFLRREITHAGWDHFFRAVIGADDIQGPGKPAPDGVLQALSVLHLPAAGVWYVGDTENDIRTAHAAGAVPVFIENLTMNTADEIATLKPAMTFKTPRECLAYLVTLG